MEELHQLEFLFENYIQVTESKSSFVKFLEQMKCVNLLIFFERASTFLKRLAQLKDVCNENSDTFIHDNSSQNESGISPSVSHGTTTHTVTKTSMTRSSSHMSPSTPTFDIYYEVEILVKDFLEPNGKNFVAHFDFIRDALAAAILERKKKQTEEVDSEAEDAVFYAKAFQDFTNSVYAKLKHDIFPRYIKSPDLIEFFQRMKEQERSILLNKVAKKQNDSLQKILYTEKEFNEDLVCERDFLFAYQLIRDQSSIWTPIFFVDEKDDNRASATYSTINFMAQTKQGETDNLFLMKYMGYLPYNVEDCAKIFFDGGYHRKTDPSVKSCNFIDTHFPNKEEEATKDFLQRKVASCTTNSNLFLGPILTKRDIVVSSSVIYYPHLEEYILVSKSVTHEKVPVQKKYIRAKIFFAISLERIASNETRFTILNYSQLGGWLKKFGKGMIKIAKSRSQLYVKTYSKAIEEAIAAGKEWREYLNEPKEKTLGYAEVFQWNQDNISPSDLKQYYKGFTTKNLFDLKTKKETTINVGVRL